MLELVLPGPEGWGDEILSGLWVTVSLALATLPFGLLLGLLIALAQNSREGSLRTAANIYTTIFRGLPELLTLFIVFYGLPLLLNRVYGMFVEGGDLQINSFLAGMLALGTVFSAYASEVFLSAFRGIPPGQYEAPRALGMPALMSMRLVVLPQLFRLALPGLSNLWMILLKETALVSVIGLPDILRQAGIAARVSKEPFLFFGIACLLYLLLAVLSSIGLSRIERWTKRGEVGAR